MAYTTKTEEYLPQGGATDDEIDVFFIFVAHLKIVTKILL